MVVEWVRTSMGGLVRGHVNRGGRKGILVLLITGTLYRGSLCIARAPNLACWL